MKRALFISSFITMLSSGLYAQEKSFLQALNSNDTAQEDSLFLDTPTIQQQGYDGHDGPYILNDTLFRIDFENKLIRENPYSKDSLIVEVDNTDGDEFYVELQSRYGISKSTYPLPEKMVVISDIEGNYNAISSFLLANKVIDKRHNWIFGNGHLVLLGDFMDRGKNVTQVLWLIYKLEQQSILQKGQVHFILGNHEILNIQGHYRYTHGKYITLAQAITGETDKSKALKILYSTKSELGRWLGTKNVIEKIGDYLFVHAGLSPETLDYGLTLDDINLKVRSAFYEEEEEWDAVTGFLYSGKGPFWYRGFVTDMIGYDKINAADLLGLLTFYNAKKIVIGHTFVPNISSAFQDKMIMLDVPHGHKKFSGSTKGLLIEQGREYIIDDLGNKKSLN